ncbi:MAG: hypothetical protein ACK4WJ_03800 [Endomicrobiia bacterium]
MKHLQKVVETVESLYEAMKNLDDRTTLKQMLHKKNTKLIL